MKLNQLANPNGPIALLHFAALAVCVAPALGQSKPAQNDDEIEAALSRTMDFVQYDRKPLEEVIDDFRRKLGINIHIYRDELESYGVDLKQPITLSLRELPAERVLRIVLADLVKDVHVVALPRDGILAIASSDTAERRLWKIQTWAVRDLIGTGAEHIRNAGTTEDSDNVWLAELKDAIRTSVGQDTWLEFGGSGAVRHVDSTLMVKNHAGVQSQIRDLLAALRAVPRGGYQRVHTLSYDRQNNLIEKALDQQREKIEFKARPLREVVEWIRATLGVNVHVHWNVLPFADAESDVVVTMKLSNVSVRRAMREMFSDGTLADCGFAVIDGVLIISTREDLERPASLEVHEVSDLVPAIKSSEALIDLITEVADPDSWQCNGGRQTIAAYGRWLFVRQTDEGHKLVRGLLEQIRQMERKKNNTKEGITRP